MGYTGLRELCLLYATVPGLSAQKRSVTLRPYDPLREPIHLCDVSSDACYRRAWVTSTRKNLWFDHLPKRIFRIFPVYFQLEDGSGCVRHYALLVGEKAFPVRNVAWRVHTLGAARCPGRLSSGVPLGTLRRLAVLHPLRRMPNARPAGVVRPVGCCRFARLFVVRGRCRLFFPGIVFLGLVWSSYHLLQRHVFPPLRDGGVLHLGLNSTQK